MGRDLIGFDPDSAFRADGKGKTGTRQLYGRTRDPNLMGRERPYLNPEYLHIHRLSDIYGEAGQVPLTATCP